MAALENGSITATVIADAAITQHRFVYRTSADTVTNKIKVSQCTSATQIPWGVAQETATADGDHILVMRVGSTKLEVDVAITQGAQIGTSADGQAVPLVAGTDVTKYVCGTADSSASTAAEKITAGINCLTPHRAA